MELEIILKAGNIAGSVGAAVCAVISLLASVFIDTVLCSSWAIYCSIMGTNLLVRAIKFKKKSDSIFAAVFLLLAAFFLAAFVIRLLGVEL